MKRHARTALLTLCFALLTTPALAQGDTSGAPGPDGSSQSGGVVGEYNGNNSSSYWGLLGLLGLLGLMPRRARGTDTTRART